MKELTKKINTIKWIVKKLITYLNHLFDFSTPPSNKNLDYTLRVSNNRKYLQLPGNKPFLWLGDTAWELFHKLSIKDAELYLRNRARKGFTIIQAVVLAELQGLTQPNANGDLPLLNTDPDHPNEKYFEHIDKIIDESNSHGMFMGMLPCWGDKVCLSDKGEPVIFNNTNAYNFGYFLGKRYKGKQIVWILGGDKNTKNRTEKSIWLNMAKGLRKGDCGRHLITYHPGGRATSYRMMQKQSALDFNMYQSGHTQKFNNVYDYAGFLYKSKPRKPFVDGEPAYEEIAVSFGEYCNRDDPGRVPGKILNDDNTIKEKSFFPKGYFNDYDIRVHAYWNFLSGACGYTYGANSIWQMFEKHGPYNIPCITDWRAALELPGAEQIKHIKTLFELYPFEKLIPNQKLITGPNTRDENHIRAATSKDLNFALLYLAKGQTVQVNIKSHLYTHKWYNPRTGEFTNPDTKKVIKNQYFSPPTSGIYNDWILILEQ